MRCGKIHGRVPFLPSAKFACRDNPQTFIIERHLLFVPGWNVKLSAQEHHYLILFIKMNMCLSFPIWFLSSSITFAFTMSFYPYGLMLLLRRSSPINRVLLTSSYLVLYGEFKSAGRTPCGRCRFPQSHHLVIWGLLTKEYMKSTVSWIAVSCLVLIDHFKLDPAIYFVSSAREICSSSISCT